MAFKYITWIIVSLILVLAVKNFGKPACRTRFHAEIVCAAGKDDYVLQRGLVSDNNNTISISLKNCRIIDIELEAFKNIHNLEEIDLSRNKISDIGPGVFNGVVKLVFLRLSKNLVTKLPLGLFDSLSELQHLDLSDNAIHFLEFGIFSHLTKLLRLDLSGNAFLGKDLDPALFNQNPKIKYLHLSRNNMLETPEQLLNAAQELKMLGLNNCSLTTVPKFVTNSNLNALEQLHLQTNKITKLYDSQTFVNLENIIVLDLIGNDIENLNESVFKPLSKLRFIDLSFNKIKQIPENLFYDMVSIETIDLSNNLIEIVPVNALRRTHLETLNLSKNRISFLVRDFCFEVTYTYRKLTNFYFIDNPFQCACLLDILNEVKKLGIKYNSDKYNGKEPVCFMTNEFTCMRHKSEFEYPMDLRQPSRNEKIPKDHNHDTLTSNGNYGVWSTFGRPSYLIPVTGV